MRPHAVVILALLVAVVAVGSLWSRNRDKGAPPPTSPVLQVDEASESIKIIRGTPETQLGHEILRSFARPSYGHDVWHEPACDGVTIFYLPDAEGLDVTWYWVDSETGQITEQTTLSMIVQALTPHLSGFEQYTPNYMIGQLSTPEGRPLYSIGRTTSGDMVQIGFSVDHCGSVPNIARIMQRKGPAPIDVDLPAAIEQLRKQERN